MMPLLVMLFGGMVVVLCIGYLTIRDSKQKKAGQKR